MNTGRKFLGMVVTPANVQTEGLEQVFDVLESLGTDAIAIDPWLLKPASEGEGSRIPDLHIDGHRRLFARPLWGQRALHAQGYLAFQPDENRYAGGPYRPAWQPLPPDLDAAIPLQMIAAARARGMAVHLGIGPLMPPNPLESDRPRLVTGELFTPPLIANPVCLNSPNGRLYAHGFILDLLSHYPDVDGLVLDWVEFAAYRLEDHFSCFCAHCEAAARAHGYAWGRMRWDMQALWDRLHDLSENDLARSRRLAANPSELLELLVHFPGCLDFLRFKADSVLNFYRGVRSLLDTAGHNSVDLTARGWIPPWNRSSGMDYTRLAGVPATAAPKIFTFDHAVLPRWFGETLLDWNPGLEEGPLLAAILDWLNLPDDNPDRRLDDYQIPAPGEPHLARLDAYQARIDEIVDQVGGRVPCYPIAHPYIPPDQWGQMLALLRESRIDGIWVNFYSYLSDAHLEILREAWQPAPEARP